MQKNYEDRLPDYLPERTVFVFSCLLSIPPSYIENARNEGVTILSALSMMPNAPAWLSLSGIIVAVVAMSKSFLGTYFGVIEGQPRW